MSRIRIPSLGLSIALLLAAVSGCGGSGESACVVVDASHSTRFAITEYLERFEESAGESADAGGSMAAVVATGKPLVESNIQTGEFAGLTGNEKTGERDEEMSRFVGDVEDRARAATAGNEAKASGSGIVAAIDLASGKQCSSLLVLSDGLETADVRMKVDDILSADGREELLDGIAERGRLPDLDGIEISFPFGGYVPQGTEIDEARLAAVPLFWEAYAARSGATLIWRG